MLGEIKWRLKGKEVYFYMNKNKVLILEKKFIIFKGYWVLGDY